MARITARENVLKYLELYSPVKRLGQHFIIDNKVIKRSVELAEVSSEDEFTILEIGPGPGVLTQELLQTGSNVVAIEIDRNAINYLNTIFSDKIESGKLKIIEGDAINIEWPKDITHIVSNIPYQISSPLLKKIESNKNSITKIILLLQDEFALRLLGEKSSNVGTLSLLTSLNWAVRKDIKISPNSFLPPPKINSRIVILEKKDKLKQILEKPPFSSETFPDPPFELISKICRHCFNNRRKKIRNTLQKLGRGTNLFAEVWDKIYSELANDEFEEYLGERWLDKRPEEFEIREWVILSSIIIKLSNNE